MKKENGWGVVIVMIADEPQRSSCGVSKRVAWQVLLWWWC